MTKYDRHIRQLCKEHGIELHYVHSDFCCNIYHKQIWIKKHIKSIRAYITALHEIGHVLNEHTDGHKNLFRDAWDTWRNKKVEFTSRYTLMKEVEAWKTAFNIAKWSNESAINRFISGISTYIGSYNVSHKKKMDLDFLCRKFQRNS